MTYTYQGLECKVDPIAEREAILKFLGKYWDVEVKKGNLADAVDYLLGEGIKYGIAYQEKEAEDLAKTHNLWVKIINSNKKNEAVKPIEFERTGTQTEFIFTQQTEKLEKHMEEEHQILAKPKDYEAFKKQHKSEDFADIDAELEFEGTPLHNSIKVSCPNFPGILKKGQIYYSEANQERSPLTEMVGSIFRQGMNLGILYVEEKYGTWKDIQQKIKKLQAYLDPEV